MTAPFRPSLSATAFPDGPWRSVIRIFAVVLALIGMALMGDQVIVNITCDGARYCSKIQLGAMGWGAGLLVVSLLVLQSGNVSQSVHEAVQEGSIVRGWFSFRRGRGTDAPGTTVATAVISPPEKSS